MLKNRIVHGSIVVELSRHGIKYTDGARSVSIEGEVLVGSSADFVVYQQETQSLEAPGTPLSEQERARILDNIKNAFAANAMVLKVS